MEALKLLRKLTKLSNFEIINTLYYLILHV